MSYFVKRGWKKVVVNIFKTKILYRHWPGWKLNLQNQQLSPIQSFYQITLGNASVLSLENKIGTLAVGSDADITILNARATSIMKIRMDRVKNLIEELFVLQTMGDDRSIAQVYIKGIPSKTK